MSIFAALCTWSVDIVSMDESQILSSGRDKHEIVFLKHTFVNKLNFIEPM